MCPWQEGWWSGLPTLGDTGRGEEVIEEERKRWKGGGKEVGD